MPLAQEPDYSRLSRAHDLLAQRSPLATEEFSNLANAGSVWSHVYLGRIYQYGLGEPVDDALAEYHYRIAFDSGMEEGLYRLGRLYFERHDFTRAHEIFGEGVSRDYLPAIYWLALTCRRLPGDHDREVVALVERAAARGHLYSQKWLFRMLKDRKGSDFDPLRAIWVYMQLFVRAPFIILRDDGYDQRTR